MKEKQLTLITWIIFSVVVIAGSGLCYYYHFVTLADLKAELVGLKGAVKAARDKVALIPNLEAEEKQLQADKDRLSSRIPNMSRLEYDKFANLMDSKREEAGVFIPNATWKPVIRSLMSSGMWSLLRRRHRPSCRLKLLCQSSYSNHCRPAPPRQRRLKPRCPRRSGLQRLPVKSVSSCSPFVLADHCPGRAQAVTRVLVLRWDRAGQLESPDRFRRKCP